MSINIGEYELFKCGTCGVPWATHDPGLPCYQDRPWPQPPHAEKAYSLKVERDGLLLQLLAAGELAGRLEREMALMASAAVVAAEEILVLKADVAWLKAELAGKHVALQEALRILREHGIHVIGKIETEVELEAQGEAGA